MDGAAAEAAAGAIALSRSVDPGLIVLGERDGLVLALRNLLDNAIKFTAGRARPRDRGRRAPRAGPRAVLGARQRARASTCATTTASSRSSSACTAPRNIPGTGVGLAIVRKAVERMHGKVWAESAKGAGATFCIQLPAVEQTPNL